MGDVNLPTPYAQKLREINNPPVVMLGAVYKTEKSSMRFALAPMPICMVIQSAARTRPCSRPWPSEMS